MSVAVVTGAGRGLGKMIAERLAKRGFSVLITDIVADAAKKTAKEMDGDVWAMAQDVSDPASHKKVADAAMKKGPIRLWVNNAGVLRSGTAWGHADEDISLQVNVNVLGVMYGCRAAVNAMSTTGGGHVINIASMSSICPVPGLAVYGATKYAVLGYTLSLQGDLMTAKLPIKCTAICPDAIETDLVRNVEDDEHSSMLFTNGKLLQAEDVADVVVETVDDYKLQVFIPRRTAALAQVMAPFPELGLKILQSFIRRGESNRKKREKRGSASAA